MYLRIKCIEKRLELKDNLISKNPNYANNIMKPIIIR